MLTRSHLARLQALSVAPLSADMWRMKLSSLQPLPKQSTVQVPDYFLTCNSKPLCGDKQRANKTYRQAGA